MCMRLNGGSSLKGELVTSREVLKKGDSMGTFWGSCIMLFMLRAPFRQAGDTRRDIRRIGRSEIKERSEESEFVKTQRDCIFVIGEINE